MERKTGFEPATLALARRYSTTELFPHKYDFTVLLYRYFRSVVNNMVRVKGLEPPRRETLDPKSSASANSATPAYCFVPTKELEQATMACFAFVGKEW
jgi:hypothetical protein